MFPAVFRSLQTALHVARDTFTPTLKHTQFLDQGKLTPEEFVAAGDYLIRLSPTWRWSTASTGLGKSYLPVEKQFLITRGVMCRRRVRDVADAGTVAETDIGDGWAATGGSGGGSGGGGSSPDEADDSYSDLSAYTDSSVAVIDPAAVTAVTAGGGSEGGSEGGSSSRGSSSSERTYEISLTYDNVYRTPRVYLAGFAADTGVPLSPTEMMEDISQDYMNKTATMERHPHILPTVGRTMVVSIHPCRHAHTMKRILDTMQGDRPEATAPSVELYLFIFLKFIASVIPTMEYDLTLSVSVAGSA